MTPAAHHYPFQDALAAVLKIIGQAFSPSRYFLA